MDYNGDATVVADGKQYTCKADLRSGYEGVRTPQGETLRGLAWWRGVLTLDDNGAFWDVGRANDVRLRIGEREGSFIVDEGTVRGIRITGNGAPPFGPQA